MCPSSSGDLGFIFDRIRANMRRWMSERYPAISQLIAENRIPEFDCLYLDMNGIIHNCTHNDSDSATFRMTEDKMFIAIFNYIEVSKRCINRLPIRNLISDVVEASLRQDQTQTIVLYGDRRCSAASEDEPTKSPAVQNGA